MGYNASMHTTVNGLSFHVSDTGTGAPVLVFLHYFGGSARTWEPVIDQLSLRFRCLALDLRGWGDSEATPTGYTVADMAADVQSVIDALELPRFILVGHSMGGKVAQVLAARAVPGLERLLLIGPSPLSPEPMSDKDRAELRGAWGQADAARKTLDTIAKLSLPEAWQQQVVEDNLRASRAAWEAWADLGSREDLSALAPEIAVPTAVLAGERDPVMSVEMLTREVVQRIPGATLTVLPGAGHLMPLEAPAAVADWITGQIGEGL